MSTSFPAVCYKYKTFKNGENPLMLKVQDIREQIKSFPYSVAKNFL